MKKYSLNSLYFEAQIILQDANIDITPESKLEISVSKGKYHNSENTGIEYVIEFSRHNEDEDYFFVFGNTPKGVIAKFRDKVLPHVDSNIQL